MTVFAMWPDQTQKKGSPMLLVAPLQDEDHLDVDSHKKSILEILCFYGKDYSNVACIPGDNCTTYRSFAEKRHYILLVLQAIV